MRRQPTEPIDRSSKHKLKIEASVQTLCSPKNMRDIAFECLSSQAFHCFQSTDRMNGNN